MRHHRCRFDTQRGASPVRVFGGRQAASSLSGAVYCFVTQDSALNRVEAEADRADTCRGGRQR